MDKNKLYTWNFIIPIIIILCVLGIFAISKVKMEMPEFPQIIGSGRKSVMYTPNTNSTDPFVEEKGKVISGWDGNN